MSSIGSGPAISSGPQALGEIRGVGAADPRAAPTPAAQTQTSAPATASAPAALVTATARNAGPVPVDGDRVKVIKKAIDAGTYPVVPAKISDAMIAAGLLLRKKP